MEEFVLYLIKTTALIGVFYLVYILFLKKETFFSMNRWFLLSGLVISIVLPMLEFTKTIWIEPVVSESVTSFVVSSAYVPSMQQVQELPVEEASFELTSVQWLMVFYVLISIGFLSHFIRNCYKMFRMLHGAKQQKDGAFTFIDAEIGKQPFSFFNYIVYDSTSFSKKELQDIIAHEKAHSSQWHSFDILFTQLLSAIFWFNPFIWLYRKVVRQNLEFLADKSAIDCSANRTYYQRTLLKATLSPENLSLVNPFFQPLIKKRIIMLNKSASKTRNLFKYALVIPLLVIFIQQFQTKLVAQTLPSLMESDNDAIEFYNKKIVESVLYLSSPSNIKSIHTKKDKNLIESDKGAYGATVRSNVYISRANTVSSVNPRRSLDEESNTVHVESDTITPLTTFSLDKKREEFFKTFEEEYNRLVKQSGIDFEAWVKDFQERYEGFEDLNKKGFEMFFKNLNTGIMQNEENSSANYVISRNTSTNNLVDQKMDIEIIIDKDTTDEQIQELTATLSKQGLDIGVSNIKRNDKGEIYQIQIQLKENVSQDENNYSRSSSSSVIKNDKNSPIGKVRIGRKDNFLMIFEEH